MEEQQQPSQRIKRKAISITINSKLEDLQKKPRPELQTSNHKLEEENRRLEREKDVFKSQADYEFERLMEAKKQLAIMENEKEAAVKATGDAKSKMYFELGVLYEKVKAAEEKVVKVEKDKEKLEDDNLELSFKVEDGTIQLKKAGEKIKRLEDKSLKANEEKDELRKLIYDEDDRIGLYSKLKNQTEHLANVEAIKEQALKDLEEVKSKLARKEEELLLIKFKASLENRRRDDERKGDISPSEAEEDDNENLREGTDADEVSADDDSDTDDM